MLWGCRNFTRAPDFITPCARLLEHAPRKIHIITPSPAARYTKIKHACVGNFSPGCMSAIKENVILHTAIIESVLYVYIRRPMGMEKNAVAEHKFGESCFRRTRVGVTD